MPCPPAAFGLFGKCFTLAHFDDLTHQHGMVAVNSDIGRNPFPKRRYWFFAVIPVACTKEAICSDIGTDDAGEYKGKTASQELLHDIFPVTVGGGAGTMEGFKTSW